MRDLALARLSKEIAALKASCDRVSADLAARIAKLPPVRR